MRRKALNSRIFFLRQRKARHSELSWLKERKEKKQVLASLSLHFCFIFLFNQSPPPRGESIHRANYDFTAARVRPQIAGKRWPERWARGRVLRARGDGRSSPDPSSNSRNFGHARGDGPKEAIHLVAVTAPPANAAFSHFSFSLGL